MISLYQQATLNYNESRCRVLAACTWWRHDANTSPVYYCDNINYELPMWRLTSVTVRAILGTKMHKAILVHSAWLRPFTALAGGFKVTRPTRPAGNRSGRIYVRVRACIPANSYCTRKALVDVYKSTCTEDSCKADVSVRTIDVKRLATQRYNGVWQARRDGKELQFY